MATEDVKTAGTKRANKKNGVAAEIKNTFCDLDIITVHAIAKMISESREKHNSALNRDMPEINISKLVLSFCKDSQKYLNTANEHE